MRFQLQILGEGYFFFFFFSKKEKEKKKERKRGGGAVGWAGVVLSYTTW